MYMWLSLSVASFAFACVRGNSGCDQRQCHAGRENCAALLVSLIVLPCCVDTMSCSFLFLRLSTLHSRSLMFILCLCSRVKIKRPDMKYTLIGIDYVRGNNDRDHSVTEVARIPWLSLRKARERGFTGFVFVINFIVGFVRFVSLFVMGVLFSILAVCSSVRDGDIHFFFSRTVASAHFLPLVHAAMLRGFLRTDKQ